MKKEACAVPEQQVLAYVAGDLPDADATALAEHLAGCDACREQATEYTALRAALPAACATGVVRWHRCRTPFGTTYLAATDQGLARLSWRQPGADAFAAELERRFPGRLVVRDPPALADVERQLHEYFAGLRTHFELPLDLSSLSPFNRRVLETITTLGFGEVIPYAELSRRIAAPRAARAVGNALGRNPLAIIVPCHRVVRSDGSLGGYTGGLRYKRHLLALEGRHDLLRAG
jgi:methylated-DNA-[protein]-cysteine S-methyltransferase